MNAYGLKEAREAHTEIALKKVKCERISSERRSKTKMKSDTSGLALSNRRAYDVNKRRARLIERRSARAIASDTGESRPIPSYLIASR